MTVIEVKKEVERGYKVGIRYHTMVDEKDPFELYAVEVHSPFSKRILKRQTQQFKDLHDKVSMFCSYLFS